MELKIPAKFKRCGIKVKCLKCKWQLNGKTCHQDNDKPQGISKCQFRDQHRYNLVVCVPNSNNIRRMRILETKDFGTALIEMKNFKEELNLLGYQKVNANNEVVKPTFVNYAADYLDCLSGKNTPVHLIRIRTYGHISDAKRILGLMGTVIKNAGYALEIMGLNDIDDRIVGMLHHQIKNELQLSNSTYNKYMRIMKSFYTWCATVREYEGKNPFAKVQLVYEKHDIRIFTKKEFMAVLDAVNSKNGDSCKRNEKRNYYRDWLKNAYRLSLETGERGEPLVKIKWSDLIEMDDGVEIFGISNLKLNRIVSGKDKGRYLRYIPVTKSLKKLLVELGYNEKKGSDEYILNVEGDQTREYVKDLIGRSFSHFAEVAGITNLTLKNLRKTYVTKLTIAMGENAKIFTGHQDVKTMQNHYLSQAYMTANLKDFDVL